MSEYNIELKPGMKCVIINTGNLFWNSEGRMDEYIGKVVTIDEINGDYINIVEDDGEWIWNHRDFALIPVNSIYHNSIGG